MSPFWDYVLWCLVTIGLGIVIGVVFLLLIGTVLTLIGAMT